MKRISTLLLTIFFVLFAKATNCADFYYIEGDVAIGVCKNYGRGIERVDLYYKGVAKALNDYLQLRQERGELERKKVHIYIYDPILTSPWSHFSQSPEDYYISLYGDKTLEELMICVDQFSQEGFVSKSSHEGQRSEDDFEAAYERREQELHNIKLPPEDIQAIKNKEYILRNNDGMKVTYQHDKIHCYMEGKEIATQLFAYPWKIRDRYIVQNTYQMDVYTLDGNLIKSYKYSDEDSFFDNNFVAVEVYDKWINFNSYGYTLSYSYDKNRFYKTNKE